MFGLHVHLTCQKPGGASESKAERFGERRTRCQFKDVTGDHQQSYTASRYLHVS